MAHTQGGGHLHRSSRRRADGWMAVEWMDGDIREPWFRVAEPKFWFCSKLVWMEARPSWHR